MKNRLALMLFVVLCQFAFAQKKSVADEIMDKMQDEVKYRLAHYMAQNTDSLFVSKAFNLGDSIEFPVHVEIEATGRAVAGKSKVSTQFDFFNTYYEKMLDSMFVFGDGLLKGGFSFDDRPQFYVSQPGKLKALYKRKYPRTVAAPAANPPYALAPVFPHCVGDMTRSERNSLFMDALHNHVRVNFNMPPKASGRMVIVLEINKKGLIENVEVPRDAGLGTLEEAIRVFKLLPKMRPALDSNGQPIPVKLTMPIVLSAE